MAINVPSSSEPVTDKVMRPTWYRFLSDLNRAKFDASLVSAFALTLLDDADASAALTTLGVSTFIKTLLDDADASAARNTLGIEVGTFTPTLAFATPGTSSFSYSTQQGNYVKVDTFYLYFAALVVTPTIGTGSGNLRFGGLPATVGSRTGSGWVSQTSSTLTWPAARTTLSMPPEANVAYCSLLGLGSGGNVTNLAASNLTGGSSHTFRYGGVFST